MKQWLFGMRLPLLCRLRHPLGIIAFILLLHIITINISCRHAYNGIIAAFYMPLQQRHCSHCNTPKLLLQQHMKISSYHRCWQFCNTREPNPRSSHHTARIRMTTGTTANSISTSEQTAIKDDLVSSSECGCGLNHDVDDSNHFNEINSEDINDMVIRNVDQSTLDPFIWQQYMVPPMSWWNVITSQLTNNENLYNSVDVSLRWNYTLDDTILTTTAERFLDLYENESAVIRRNRRAPWWSRVPTIAGTTTSSTPPNPYREVMIQNIASAMKQFSTFCSNSNHSDEDDEDPSFHRRRRSGLSLTIRLLCTYGGSRAGTKCPIWHIDHVPCRYIQTLYGPTCLFINNSRDNRIVYNRIVAQQQEDGEDRRASDLDDSTSNEEFLSVEERNEFLLRDIDVTSRSVIGQATVGEGIILLGKLWSRWATATATPLLNDDQTNGMIAAVHKSPQILTPNQGRILLTININE